MFNPCIGVTRKSHPRWDDDNASGLQGQDSAVVFDPGTWLSVAIEPPETAVKRSRPPRTQHGGCTDKQPHMEMLIQRRAFEGGTRFHIHNVAKIHTGVNPEASVEVSRSNNSRAI